MVELDDQVIDEAVHRGETMLVRDLFDLVERAHDERPGIGRETLGTYAHELAARPDYSFDAEGFLATVDEHTTDQETWAGDDAFYEVDDGCSQYPARWHERLGGSDDVAAYLRFLYDDAPEFVDDIDHGGAGPGIPEDTLVHVLQVVGRMDRGAATTAVEDARDEGVIAEDVDQHPEAGVYLTERLSDDADQQES